MSSSDAPKPRTVSAPVHPAGTAPKKAAVSPPGSPSRTAPAKPHAGAASSSSSSSSAHRSATGSAAAKPASPTVKPAAAVAKAAAPASASHARPASSAPKVATPADVLKLTGPTQAYMCPLAANTYGIDFIEFKIREMESNKTLFHVRKDADAPTPSPAELDDSARFIQYDFGAQFLDLKTVGTSLVFKVGPKELKSFRMIERHYFGTKLLKSFDFTFGFCIPGSTNEWEVIYTLPKLSDAEKKEIIANPYMTKSDSFYFVEDQLVMHNKAEYAYTNL
eukprot:m51a1_g619 hypothetical protein (278) ;mRNA; r:109121-110172